MTRPVTPPPIKTSRFPDHVSGRGATPASPTRPGPPVLAPAVDRSPIAHATPKSLLPDRVSSLDHEPLSPSPGPPVLPVIPITEAIGIIPITGGSSHSTGKTVTMTQTSLAQPAFMLGPTENTPASSVLSNGPHHSIETPIVNNQSPNLTPLTPSNADRGPAPSVFSNPPQPASQPSIIDSHIHQSAPITPSPASPARAPIVPVQNAESKRTSSEEPVISAPIAVTPIVPLQTAANIEHPVVVEGGHMEPVVVENPEVLRLQQEKKEKEQRAIDRAIKAERRRERRRIAAMDNDDLNAMIRSTDKVSFLPRRQV